MPAEKSRIDAIIELAEKAPKIAEAHDKIMKLIFSRAYPGDFCGFADGQNKDKVKISVGGAGAERIASFIGISFRNFKSKKETGTDKNGSYYDYVFTCDAVFGNRIIESVEGRAGTRDKFFGKAYGAIIPADEISESNIAQAARRNAMKEGTRQMLGLRLISKEQAVAMGLDESKINVVGFGGKGKGATTTSDSAKDAGEQTEVEATVTEVVKEREGKGKTGKEWVLYSVHTDKGDFKAWDDNFPALKAVIGQKAVLGLEVNDRGDKMIKSVSQR
jgi:hypothetical protein